MELGADIDTARSLSTAQRPPHHYRFSHYHIAIFTRLFTSPLSSTHHLIYARRLESDGLASLSCAIRIFPTMATNGDFSDEGDLSQPGSPVLDGNNAQDFDDQEPLEKPLKSALKKSDAPAPSKRPELPEQSDPATLDLSALTPLTPEVIVGYTAYFPPPPPANLN